MGITTTGRNTADDLRAIHQWLIGHPSQTEVVDIANRLGSGTRYARELLAVLIQHGQIDADHVVITGSGTFEQWLVTTNQAAPKQAKPKAPATPAAGRECGCGCGEQTSKAKVLYRPGHDARHAGAVARQLAPMMSDNSQASKDRSFELLLTLPSVALREKASKMAGRIAAKAAASDGIETGTVKVGRWAYAATRNGERVTYSKKSGEIVEATAKVAATFTK